MKNMTLAIVAALVAVAMLSAVLAVPMQEASAGGDGGSGGNSIKINQKNDCERASCTQTVTLTPDQSIED
jgi:hypothetical protein